MIGARSACESMWGKAGIDQVASALAPDVRDRIAGFTPLPEWLALSDLIAWHFAVWNGPVKQDWQVMMHFARVTVDQGFGRVKRMMISALTPQMLAQRVGPIWSEEYSTGQLETLAIDAHSVKLRLREHAYVDIPLMSGVIAEAYRHVLSMTRAHNVQVEHEVRGAALHVSLRWQ